MRLDILTLFPDMFAGPFERSIIGRAIQAGHVQVLLHDIRDWAADRHRTVDDTPYGGGAGMVVKANVLGAAKGRLLTQGLVEELARRPRLLLLCGRYEGIDERARVLYVDEEISIGDYVLTGGELPAMVLVDAIVRLLPGVLDEDSLIQESHGQGLLEHPHYTRPAVFGGLGVPPVLTSGHHGAVARWRRQESLRRTLERRPDLLARARLTPEDRSFLQTLGWFPPEERH